MLPFLLALLILFPIAEIFVMVQVGQAIGFLPTLALLFLSAVLGIAIVRHQGRVAWRELNSSMDQRRMPGGRVVNGTLIFLGGLLLIPPGFISSVLGLLLLFPPTRYLARLGFAFFIGRRIRVVTGPAGWGADRMRGRWGGRTDYDFEGQAEDVTERPPNGPPRQLRSPGSEGNH